MRKLMLPFIFCLLCTFSCYSMAQLYRLHGDYRERILGGFSGLPEPLARALALEFAGVASDILMLKTLVFTGDKLLYNDQLTQSDWQTVHKTLVQITNLDPRFLDPYLVAAMSLPFEPRMVEEANSLLEKAANILTDDYRPNFFLWYNHYQLLQDHKTAAKYLEKAARKPNAPPYFSTLAARTHFKGGDIYASVVFLQEVISETSDPVQLKFLKTRLQAFQKVGFLEQKILEYRKKLHFAPKNLQELVKEGIIGEIPSDPYGGKFYITENGRVYTTSKFVFPKKK